MSPKLQQPEDIEFGRYRLIRKIATGGMAQIWLAIQRGPHGFEKVAVLKVILPELCDNDAFVQMFLDEARLAAGLDHNNVVRVYDFGQTDGRYYLAMEYLPGEDLASLMQAHKRANQPVPIAAACEIVIGAAAGLHFAHDLTDAEGKSLRVVHRDVSPSNIIVTYQGAVKVVDFGIARAASNITKTVVGALKGKVSYLSPEQASDKPIDRRSDVFALGTVLYELLTLDRPFRRDNELATLHAVLHEPIAPPSARRPDLPPELDDIVLRAMARDPEKRFPTAAALAQALTAFLINRGYIRSEQALATYLASMFDEPRRLGKLRVSPQAFAAPGVPQRTPSALRNLELSPMRSMPVPAPAPAPTPAPTAEDPTIVRPVEPAARFPKKGWAIGGVLLGGLALSLVLVVLKPGQSGSVTVPASTPNPKTVPRPAPPRPVPSSEVKVPEPVRTAQNLEVSAPSVPLDAPPESPEPSIGESTEVARAQPPKAKAGMGKLSLATSPWCEVFLNGKKLGDTPLIEVPLPAGMHVLTLVNPHEGMKDTIRVEIEAGKTTVKKRKL